MISKQLNNQGQHPIRNAMVIAPCNPQASIPTQNRFETLTETESEAEITMDFEEQHEEAQVKAKNKKATLPPPIIIPNKDNNELIKQVRLIIHEAGLTQHSFKYTGNNINLCLHHIDTIEQHNKARLLLNNKRIPYYTFTNNQEKTHAFVLRELDHAPYIEQIKEALTLLQIQTKESYNMKKTIRPFYLVITDPTTSLKELNSKASALLNTRVSWEIHRNRRGIIQCHRCQQWGHATANCTLPYKCLKCAAPHDTATDPRQTNHRRLQH